METFAEKLRAELDTRELSVRHLSRLLADGKGIEHAEQRRIQLHRWLRGHIEPSRENRHQIEDVLGVPRDSLRSANVRREHAK